MFADTLGRMTPVWQWLANWGLSLASCELAVERGDE